MAKTTVTKRDIVVTLTLNEKEAMLIRALTGGISGIGPLRTVSDGIYEAIDSLGLPEFTLNNNFYGISDLEIKGDDDNG